MTKLTRRDLVLTTAASLILPTTALAQPSSLKDAARDMWLFTLPLVEMAVVRARQQQRPNRLGHARTLSGPAQTTVTTPNNDTLYSTGWLDLRGGPVTLTIPPAGKRYVSVAFMDMYTNNFVVLGGRQLASAPYSTKGGTWVIAGPDAPASTDPYVIRSPTPWVWMLGRTLVESEADLPAVHALQDKWMLTAPAPSGPPAPPVARFAPWQTYFPAAQALLAENPPLAQDKAFLAKASALSLAADKPFNSAAFTPAQAAEIAAGVAEGQAIARGKGGVALQGNFGSDYQGRARTALSGLGALPPAEAVYTRIPLPKGMGKLETGKSYKLSFTKAQLPPVDGFWSLSMYRTTDQGQLFFAENPIHRYAIGDRTPGLKFRPDGGLDLWIGPSDPGGEKSANWLPAPATGDADMVLRGYLARKGWLDGKYQPPALAVL